MKLFGHSEASRASGAIGRPAALAEVTLVATPTELRRIAEFLAWTAGELEVLGTKYDHEHLSDWDGSFESGPEIVVAR